jgi:hypothetical protein
MPAAWVSAGVATVGLVNSMTSSGGGGGGGSTGQQYDPYSPYRDQAATQLNSLMNNPSQAMSQPGYQQTLQQGEQQVNRGMAASGQLSSGQEQASLQNLGQNTFGSYYNAQLANLMQLSGASASPAAAAQAQTQANLARSTIGTQNLTNMASGAGALIGGVNQGVNNWGNAQQVSQANNQMSAWNNQDFSGNNYSAGMNPMNIVSDQ